jgi:ABC-type bacteriocin/lantibiotic exporter with double-glycine peptidase domain
MSDSFRILPHIEQIKGKNDPRSKCQDIYTCGAASLCMIYQHFGIQADHDTIWREISSPRPFSNGGSYTRTINLLRHALNNRIPCTCASLKEPMKSFALFLDKGVELILLHHRTTKTVLGHFTVLSGIQGGSIYVNDPFYSPDEGGINRRIRGIEDLMRPSREPNEEIGRKNTVLAFLPPIKFDALQSCLCPHCGQKFPIIHDIVSESEAILCPNCEYWIESGQSLSVDHL